MFRPDLPRRLKVVRMEPARIKIHVDRLVRRTMPVRADLAGTPALGYTVAESVVVPDHVEVSGPAGKIDELKEITTEPIDLRGMKDNVQRSVLLGWAGDFVGFVPDHVMVNVRFEEVMVSREFKRVDVRVLHGEDVKTSLAPSYADVSVRGPQRVLVNFKLEDGAVYVDANGLSPGTQEVPVRVDLPPPLELVHVQPEMHRLTITAGSGR
jgi:YbbR domain-containing protein